MAPCFSPHSQKTNKATSKVRVFTVLRHPMERAISTAVWWYKHERRNGSLVAYFLDDTAEQVAWHGDKLSKHRSFLHHAMVYQLGDCIDARRRSHEVTPAIALERAKAMLETHIDYIGFCEWALHCTV